MNQPESPATRPVPTSPAGWPGDPPGAPPAPADGAPDPGSPRARLFALVACLILVPTVVILNQIEAMAEPAAPTSAFHADGMDPVSLVGKMAIKIEQWGKSMGTPSANAPTWMSQLDSSATGPADKLRIAVAAAELVGPDQAKERLEALDASLASGTYRGTVPAPGPELSADELAALNTDIDSLQRVYSGDAGTLSEDERTGLKTRFGWWGELALTYGLPDTDPTRAGLLGGGPRLITTLFAAGGVFLIWTLGAIAAFIAMLVMISSGRIKRRFVPPAPGGSVYLETLAIFVGGFLALQFIPAIVALAIGGPPPTSVSLGLQWVLVLTPFWPLLRGVSFSHHRRLIGWHSGRGVFREIGCGVLAYFAGLPLLVVALVVTLILMVLYQYLRGAMGAPQGQPHNPIVDILMSGDPLVLVMLFLLASVWAPFVEESIFRGGFYRHLRARYAVPLCAVASALVFGVMHGYQFLMLLPVITLGFVFALMREWRGSLIAPITAHALHNGTILAIVISLLTALR